MPGRIYVKNKSEAARLERNLTATPKGKRTEDPAATIKRLRAEVAMLKEMLKQRQALIDALNREIGARMREQKEQ